MKRFFVHLSLLLLLLCCSSGAWAVCTFPSQTAAFGTVTSFTAASTPSNTSSVIQLNCGAGLNIGLLATDTITLRLPSATYSNTTRGTLKTSSSSTDAIPVQLCTVSGCGTELTISPATSASFNSSQLLSLVTTGKNFSIPVYLRTVPTAAVAAGSYAVTLNVQISYTICIGANVAGLCVGTNETATVTEPLTVSLTITNDCTTITAPNINFNSAPLVSSFSSVSQSISVVCTKGSSYTIGMNNGNNAVNNQRYMISGSNQLAYEIYKGSSSNRWGPTGSDRQSSANASSTSTDGQTKTYSYTASVLTSQATPPAGSYSDSIVVDLSF